MPESESGALPFGDSPIYRLFQATNGIIHDCVIKCKHFFKNLCWLLLLYCRYGTIDGENLTGGLPVGAHQFDVMVGALSL